MLKVLVLQEKSENVFNIRDSLPECDIHLFDHVNQALQSIAIEDNYDLIISAVHMEHDGSVFDFLKAVKSHSRFQHIPFVFYCSRSSTFARSVRHGLQIAAQALGADHYITMERYDKDTLRQELLAVLPDHLIEDETASGNGDGKSTGKGNGKKDGSAALFAEPAKNTEQRNA